MQKFKTFGLVFSIVLVSAPHGRAQGGNPPAFEKLKTLVGEWESVMPDGQTTRTTYRLTAEGSALVETMMPGEPKEMVTVYHPEGDGVMMAHYCAAKNQPRLRAGGGSGEIKEIAFKFLDITNLSSPAGAHMRELLVTFEDNDHFTARWTYRENGTDSPSVFTYIRKK